MKFCPSETVPALVRTNYFSNHIYPFPPRHPSSSKKFYQHSTEKLPTWEQYFDEKLNFINEDGQKFNVYRKGDSSLPALLLIHGGGFTGLTWSHFVNEITKLSKVQCIAPDLRGHGLSTTFDDSHDFYSLDNFCKDLTFIVQSLPGFKDTQKIPQIILFGHSMGGAIVSHLANFKEFYAPACIALFDVIEGSALAALPAMEGVIKSRPNEFDSEHHAVNWALQTGYIKNTESAKISMPSQVIQSKDKFEWVTDLAKTRPFWDGWFRGMDKKFLNASCGPKIVLVQDPNNLDKEMTIAQMQGKFQIQMLPSSGHAVHEDQPLKIAQKISTYLARFKLAEQINTKRSAISIPKYGSSLPSFKE